MNFINEAWKEKSSTYSSVKVLTHQIIEKLSRKKIKSYKLWIENRNSRIYLIEDTNHELLVAKQSKNLSFEELRNEFKSLEKLSILESHSLKIPKAIGLDSSTNTYIMEFVDGESIASLVGSKNNQEKLLTACYIAGKVIADFHRSGNKSKNTITINNIVEDIELIPYGLKSSDKEILKKAVKILDNLEFSVGQVYRDYDPLNIYYSNKKISLIDPPGINYNTFLLWDIATFNFGLKKAFLKKTPFISGRRNKMLKDCKRTFIEGYINNISIGVSNCNQIFIMLDILELQRLGELMVFHKKHKYNNKRIISIRKVFNILSLIILYIEKIKLFSELKKKVNNSN